MQGILPFQAPEAKVVPQGFLPQAVTPPTRNTWSDMVPELLKTVVGGAIQMKLQQKLKRLERKDSVQSSDRYKYLD